MDTGLESLESGLPRFEDDIADEFSSDLDSEMPRDISETFAGDAAFGALAEDRDDDMTEDDLSEELGTEKYFGDDADDGLEDDDLRRQW